ncbi:VOC family protein [Starkeya koreensis]|uniref:VOC family protein n=1 Tax=Ancylobacter koreensis TaxID=266121 RepID=A0ABT0DQA3_9HYPH|nr:VOC family protein [Ancylobacter koreensis]MCK0209450.1 VOC family protein [Ancylobacter koreensis]
MSRIVHIALKCGDMESFESATTFYEDIFGIYQTKNTHARGHHSRHMTDGNIDLALMLYDSEDEKEAKLAGAGPRIHHIGIEVDDRPSMIKKIEDNGGSIYSDRAEGALKYRSADGTLGEIVGIGRYLKKDKSKLSRISQVTLHVNDLEKAANFYRNVFDFEPAPGSNGVVHNLTDGETVLSLVKAEQPAIEYWTLEVADPKAVAEQVTQRGGKIVKDDEAAVKFVGPDGNLAELTGA